MSRFALFFYSGLFLLSCFLFVVVFYSTGCANEYALEECKKAIENVANAAVTSSSPVAPVSIAVLPEEEPRSFVIVGKTIPTAYLVALDSKISRDDYITKEVRGIFDRTPMRVLATVRCPRNRANAEYYAGVLRIFYRQQA